MSHQHRSRASERGSGVTAKKAKRPVQTPGRPLQVLYVELRTQADVDAYEAVLGAARGPGGRAVKVAALVRQLFVDAARRGKPVVVDEACMPLPGPRAHDS